MPPFSNIDCEQTICNYYLNRQLSEQVPDTAVDPIEGSSVVIWENQDQRPLTPSPLFLAWQRHCKG